MNRIIKKRVLSVMAIVLGLILVPITKAIATYNLDPKVVTVTFAEKDASFYGDLNEIKVPFSFYQIAEMDEDGNYSVTDEFAKFSMEGDADKSVDYIINNASSITAEELLAFSNSLEMFINENNSSNQKITAEAEGTISGGSENRKGTGEVSVVPGLYLICVPDIKTDFHDYHFSPSLAFVPNTVEIELKAKQDPLTADLTITKALTDYDAITGEPMFVFDVVAEDEAGNVVLSDVVGIRFNGPGEKSALVSGIPAGSKVTVTEVYSNGAYTISPDSSTVFELNKITPNESDKNVANFTNEGTKVLVFGTGVVNHFEVHENEAQDQSIIYSWEWEQQ